VSDRPVDGGGVDLATSLARIRELETGLRTGLIGRTIRAVGGTRAYAAGYRRIGPRVDPWLMRQPWGRALLQRYGIPGLLLATTGARTGRRRVSPVLYVRDGDAFACVGTNFGQPRHPGWTANLLAHPEATVTIGDVTLPVTAEPVDEAGFARLWPRFLDIYPGYADYLPRRRGLAPRMFLLHPHA
jgi:deazaflavin-dependent oxidoreductase (nitroreductase family)